MDEKTAFIEVQDLGKEYPGGEGIVPAIRQMDFTVDDGEFLAIMGPSGSGKSTLLSILGGLNHPTRGQVLVDTLDVYGLTGEQRADFRSEYLGFIFQSFQLIPYLTVRENVMLPMAVTGVGASLQNERAWAVLERVGLTDKASRLPDQLSGGEQERVAIARAVVNRPPVLLADEPTGNLDSATTGQIMTLLQGLNEEGLTILMVTHNSEVSTFARRILQVRDGYCVFDS